MQSQGSSLPRRPRSSQWGLLKVETKGKTVAFSPRFSLPTFSCRFDFPSPLQTTPGLQGWILTAAEHWLVTFARLGSFISPRRGTYGAGNWCGLSIDALLGSRWDCFWNLTDWTKSTEDLFLQGFNIKNTRVQRSRENCSLTQTIAIFLQSIWLFTIYSNFCILNFKFNPDNMTCFQAALFSIIFDSRMRCFIFSRRLLDVWSSLKSGDLIQNPSNSKAPSVLRRRNLKTQPSTLIRHENGAFRKRSSNPRNLKTPALGHCGRQTFWKRNFSKTRHHDNLVISLTEFSSNTNPKWPVIVAFSNFSGVVWTENVWRVFRVKRRFQISPVYGGRGLFSTD